MKKYEEEVKNELFSRREYAKKKMEEDTKELILGIIVVGIFLLALGSLLSNSNKYNEQRHQKNIQEINECFEKTNDKNWCLNKFLK